MGRLARLGVAIDASGATIGALEFAKAKASIKESGRDVSSYTKALADGFVLLGKSTKGITPDILALVDASSQAGKAARLSANGFDELKRSLSVAREMQQFQANASAAEKAVRSLEAALDREAFKRFRQTNTLTSFAPAAGGNFGEAVYSDTTAQKQFAAKVNETLREQNKLREEAASKELQRRQDETRAIAALLAQEKQVNDAFEERLATRKRLAEEARVELEFENRLADVSKKNSNFGANVSGPGINRNARPQSRFGANIGEEQGPKELQGPPDIVANSFTKRVGDAARASENLNNRLKDFVARTQQSKEETEKLGSSLSGLRGELVTLAVGFSATFAIRNAILDGVETLKDYSKTLTELRVVSNASAEDLDKLAEASRNYGVTSVYGANATAAALKELAKAGFSVNEQLSSLPTVLAFATSADIDLATSADLTSKTLRQFKLDISESARAADSLVNVANAVTTSVLPLTEALVNVGPAAADLNIPIETTNALLGVLAERGIVGGAAGTKLRGVFQSLLNPTKEARTVLEELRSSTDGTRLSFEKVNPVTNNIIDVFKRFKDGNLTLTESTELFNNRFATTGLILAEGIGRVEDLLQVQEEQKGKTKEINDLIENSLYGSYEKLTNAVEEFTLSIGDKGASGALKTFLDYTREVFISLAGSENRLDSVSTSAKATASSIKVLAAATTAYVGVKAIQFFADQRFGLNALRTSYENATIAVEKFKVAKAGEKAGAALGIVSGTAPILGGVAVAAAAVYEIYSSLKNSTAELTESQREYNESLKLGKERLEQLKKLQATGRVSEQINLLKAQFEEITKLVEEPKELGFLPNAKLKVLIGNLNETKQKLLEINEQRGINDNSRDIDVLAKGARNYLVLLGAKDELEKKILELENRRDGTFAPGELFKEASSSLEKYLDNLELEERIATETVGMTKQQAKERAAVLTATYNIAKKAQGAEKDQIDILVKATEKQIARIYELINARKKEQEIADKREDGASAIAREIEQLRARAQVTELPIAIRKREYEVIRLSNLAKEYGLTLTDEQIKKIKEYQRAIDEDKNRQKGIKDENLLERIRARAFEAFQNQQERKLNSTEDAASSLVEQYVALAQAADESSEAQKRATALARFDAITRNFQTEKIRNLRKELEQALITIQNGDNRAAVRAVENLVAGYEQQAEAISQTEDQARSSYAFQQFAAVTLGKELDTTGEKYEAFKKRLEAALKTINAGPSKGRQKDAEDILRSLDAELDALKGTNEEREKAVNLEKLRAVAVRGNIEGYDELQRKIKERTEELQDLRKIREIADGIGDSFADAFGKALEGANSLHDVVNQMFRDIVRQATSTLVTKPLSSAVSGALTGFFGSFANSGGNNSNFIGPPVQSWQGNVFAFAAGGVPLVPSLSSLSNSVINQPTAFPMRNGMGLGGERGPEAIVPLKRDANGNLGVSSSGGGGTKVINVTIVAQDVNSFNKSRRQIAEDFKKFGGN